MSCSNSKNITENEEDCDDPVDMDMEKFFSEGD